VTTRRAAGLAAAVAAVLAGCAPTRYRPPALPPADVSPPPQAAPSSAATPVVPATSSLPQPDAPLGLDEVIASVTSRYPPWLSTLLERDLASGRLLQAMGNFDTNLTSRIGRQVAGYYEATTFGAQLEQPLATGDTVYGGYRISDGGLPDYSKDRTQDAGELVFGGRIPLFRDRGFDRRRAVVRQAEIDAELADPTIARARIDYVRSAARVYYAWVAAGQRLRIANDLLRLATERVADLQRGVERQFLAAIDVTDNERLIAQRQTFVARAERQLQQAALELSLFLRDAGDAPIVPDGKRLPADVPAPQPLDEATLMADTEEALQRRPELRRLQLQLDRAETDRQLASNQTQPQLDVVVEASRSLSSDPYLDPSQEELFVGGELRLPLRQRDAYGRLAQAEAAIRRLQIDNRFTRDRIVNDVADARSALRAAHAQYVAGRRNADLARQVVDAEKRAFELGRSDMFRVQLRELQFADAEALAVEAWLDWHRALADHRAARGVDATAAGGGP
jgi:cobalt-zinc-cadmium efflux system outer membrane protein